MNLYNVKDNDLIVVKCRDEQGEDKNYNSVYKIAYRKQIKDRDETILGGKMVLLYPSQVNDTCGVKYYIGNEEFDRMKGQIIDVRESKNLKSIAFIIDHDEDGEIVSLGESLYRIFEEELIVNQPVRIKCYPDPTVNVMVDGYFEYNYCVDKDQNTIYVFTPLIDYVPEDVGSVTFIDMSDKAFVQDLGIKFETMKKEDTILALTIALPIIHN